MSNVIIYVGPYSFPNGGAAARRILGNCCTLRSLGYEVVITSGQKVNDEPRDDEYEGFRVISLNERTSEHLPKLLKHFSYFNIGKKTILWLNSLDTKPKAVVLYSGYTPYLRHLSIWCKENKVPLIFDSVEWYQPKSKILTFFSPYYLNIELAMRFYAPRTRNLIVISEYLEKFYIAKKCNVVRIPPTLDTLAITPSDFADNNYLELVYAGSPGHKDLLDNILEAVLTIYESGHSLHLNLVGITDREILSYCSLSRRGYSVVPDVFNCQGRVSHDTAIRMVASADFSVLSRPTDKYAMAGFPTKFVESMAVGTPIITNLTSDLANYLTHGVEGLICADIQSESIEEQILNALALSDSDRRLMRKNARRRAELSFDFTIYKDSFSEFINRLQLI